MTDAAIINGTEWTENRPTDASVSNAYRTRLYVKVGTGQASGIRIPLVTVESVDENGSWYRQTAPSFYNPDAMDDKEKKLFQDGYYAFDLGKLYGDTRVTIELETYYQLRFESSGFPDNVRIIRYEDNGNGSMHEWECGSIITEKQGGTVWFQLQWDEDPGYQWCRSETSAATIGAGTPVTLERRTFDGISGEVMGITVWDDVIINTALKPHTISLDYIAGDIRELKVNSDYAALSEDKNSVRVYGGDTLSLSFKLADEISLKEVSCSGGAVETVEKDGGYTVTVQNMAEIQKVQSISMTTEDAYGRYLLSAMRYEIQLEQDSLPYTGSFIEPKVKQVTVYLPNAKKGTILREGTDFTTAYFDNINVGTATITITAAQGSARYRGSISSTFEIVRAEAPAVEEKQVHMDISCAGTTQQLDLFDVITIDTPSEKGIKPTGFRLDLSDPACTLGDIMKGDPVLQGGTLVYSIWADATKYSEPAVVVVYALSDNYKDTRIALRLWLTRKETITFSGALMAEDKVYDGMPVQIFPDKLYVESVNGEQPGNLQEITQQVRASLTYYYTGTGDTVYSSRTAPVNAGTYQVSAAVSEENRDYASDYTEAASFTISKRPLEFAADNYELYIGDSVQEEYGCRITGDGLAPDDYIGVEPLVDCTSLNTAQLGEYPVVVHVEEVWIYNQMKKDVTQNYALSGKSGVVRVIRPKVGSYTVTYSLTGHGQDIIRSGMEAGSLLARPKDPVAFGYVFLGWYKDEGLTERWDFDTDTIQDNITLYAGWSEGVTGNKGTSLCIQKIADQPYTGKAIKPAVTVYTEDGKTLLKAGKDYSISYANNIEADTSTKKFGGGEIPKGGVGVRSGNGQTVDSSGGFEKKLAYVIITGKGNYNGTVCMNFHINAASIGQDAGSSENETMPTDGFTLKYTDQFEAKPGRNGKLVSALKYKSTLKYQKDYILSVQKTGDGESVTLTEKGELPLSEGTYTMTITGQGNYTGSITKKIYVASKGSLMKNARIGYARTISNADKVQIESGITQTDVSVSLNGTPLSENVDYDITYSENHAIGTAVMTVTGKNGYVGSKSVSFKIKGIAFKEKEFEPIQIEDLTYTGSALTQNDVTLIPENSGTPLVYGVDYVIGYKDNINRGNATMLFTAKPSSGYSGSFKKTFKIKPERLEAETVIKEGIMPESSKLALAAKVPYSKGGAKPSDDKFAMYINGRKARLKEGRDYTVKYKDNTEVSSGKAYMEITGKGNYTGRITVYFDIENASLLQAYQSGRLSITAAPIKYKSKIVRDADGNEYDRYEDEEYEPAVTIKDGKKALKQGEDGDYTVTYVSNCQSDVSDWQNAAPYAEIRGIGRYGGADGTDEGGVITIPLSIYQKKLSAGSIYVVYGEEAEYTYTGQQITPEITVYFGNASDIKKARNAQERDESVLTEPKPDKGSYEPGEEIPYAYGLTKLVPQNNGTGGNYILTYGENNREGKNGTIKITGTGGCTGSVAVKFSIGKKTIYNQQEEADGESEEK